MSADTPFDRGEVDRSSLEATDRLRARLAARAAPPAAAPRRAVLPWVLTAMLFVFVAGMVANPWFEANVRRRLPFAQAGAPAPAVEVAALSTRLAALEGRIAPTAAPPPVERLARTEAQVESSSDQIAREAQRLDRLTADVAALNARLQAEQARTAAAAASVTAVAARAEALLVIDMTRRAMMGGRPLGPLEPLLRRNFAARQPDEVRAVLALGAAPVARQALAAQLARLAALPSAGGAIGESWWQAFTRVVAEVVRPAAPETSGLAAAAVQSASNGDIAMAARTLRQLPPGRLARFAPWLAAADRLEAGEQALARLEDAAVLLPPPAAPVE